MNATPTPSSILTLTLVITCTAALIGCWVGWAIAAMARTLATMREADRPSALPAYRAEAHKARTGVWTR